MWGLFDHTNQAFRILAALCIQSVLAELATAPPRDEYKDWHVDEMPVPEYGVGIWHEAAVADVFINMYARTPELSIAALDKIVADRQRAVDIAMAKAALAEAHYMQTGKRDIPPQFEFVRKLANVNGGNNEKKNKGKKKSGGGVGGGGNGGGNGTTSSLEADSATTTFKPPLPLSLPVEIEPSTTSSPQDQLPVDDNPASTHPRLLRAASTRLDPLPYLLRGPLKREWECGIRLLRIMTLPKRRRRNGWRGFRRFGIIGECVIVICRELYVGKEVFRIWEGFWGWCKWIIGASRMPTILSLATTLP
ncbi:hypothetical protein BC829DRAFT_253068 [Chytridium lagenaria]|nr:hypothetical protein BC829DRAFT_253068 [Chytridium lagenaria]